MYTGNMKHCYLETDGKTCHAYRLEVSDISEMSILTKLIYVFNVIFIIIPMAFFKK